MCLVKSWGKREKWASRSNWKFLLSQQSIPTVRVSEGPINNSPEFRIEQEMDTGVGWFDLSFLDFADATL